MEMKYELRSSLGKVLCAFTSLEEAGDVYGHYRKQYPDVWGRWSGWDLYPYGADRDAAPVYTLVADDRGAVRAVKSAQVE